MEIIQSSTPAASSVNYDETPIVQAQIEGADYRIDTGLGSSLAVSRREAGTWQWTPVCEGRWDGSRLRAKGLDHPVIVELGQALAQAMRDREDAS
jgi:hypothetical protein